MDLNERLGAARSASPASDEDAFTEVKNRMHLAVIGELGPQLFAADVDPVARARSRAHRPAQPSRAGVRDRP